MEHILEMKNIWKQFPGVLALRDVSLKIRKGTVHALMGENGAGKSTLMKILMGMYQPNQGEISLNGKIVEFPDTHTSLNLGISMIHQELSSVPQMTVAENIWLGREPRNRIGLINHEKMHKMTEALLSQLRISIDPETAMISLSVANRQMVEIAKAISYDSEIIIMDEPTSAITEQEVAHLFSIIRELKERRVSIIYITHKMDEVFEISDDITVLRDGQFIGTDQAANLDKAALISMMVGREMTQMFPKTEVEIGDVILSVRDLASPGLFSGVSFDLHRGEILGIAGLMGAGRTEVVETLFGIRPRSEGTITLHGKDIAIDSPEDAIKLKMALLTEDRKESGLYLMLSVLENMEVAAIPKFMKGLFVDHKSIRTACTEQIGKLNTKTPSLAQTIGNLSGGNQQKVLISRWLLTHPEILMLDEPTRGIDVGAKAEIHKLMCKLASEGRGIIMISSELPEVLGMSDRVLVMHEGKMAGILSRSEATQENILTLASGEALKKV